MRVIVPDYRPHTDQFLALSGQVLQARIDNADLMLSVDAELREKGIPGCTLAQVEHYVRDRIEASAMLAALHAEYERRIGELCHL